MQRGQYIYLGSDRLIHNTILALPVFTLVPMTQTYFLMGVDVMAPGFSLRIFNFYHHVPHRGHGLR